MKSILLVKMFLGLVEITSGLANATCSFSLPEWQAVKMINFSLYPVQWRKMGKRKQVLVTCM